MTSGDDKWIRSIKDNPAGKVVADPEGNRWEWEQSDKDETARLLRKLENDELAIERTDIKLNPLSRREHSPKRTTERREPQPPQPTKKLRGRDDGGGFNPYDSSGKPRR